MVTTKPQEKGRRENNNNNNKKRIQNQIPGREGAAPRQTFQFQKKKARRRRSERSLSFALDALKP